MFGHLVLGVRDYVRKNGFKSVVVGSSGGIDSAVVLAIAEQAIGKENVFAITMPSKFSSEGSVDDSEELCKNLGIKLYNRSIAGEVMQSIENFKSAFGEDPSRLTIENEQARIRGRILMEFSNHFGALVLSTGNKSEVSCGYFTLYGDSNGGLAVIADLYKTEVFALARWMNENIYARRSDGYGAPIPGIPELIINKAPSAELWENQKDTDSLPPYPALDGLLRLFLEGDVLDGETIKESLLAIRDLSPASMLKILGLVDQVEYKRSQLPPTIRVHRRAWGTGRAMPITHRHRMDEAGLFSFLAEIAHNRHKGGA
jgi:NAD+ synthetase